jgi:hypothetical protein
MQILAGMEVEDVPDPPSCRVLEAMTMQLRQQGVEVAVG